MAGASSSLLSGGRRGRTDDAVFSCPAVSVRRHLARNRHPLYEPVPETGLHELFAARYLPQSRHLQDDSRENRLRLGRRLAFKAAMPPFHSWGHASSDVPVTVILAEKAQHVGYQENQ